MMMRHEARREQRFLFLLPIYLSSYLVTPLLSLFFSRLVGTG